MHLQRSTFINEGSRKDFQTWSIINTIEPNSLLICTLRSHFEGDRKAVLQTQIFFHVGQKWFCKHGLQPRKNPSLFCSIVIRKLNKLMGLELTSFFSFCLDRMLCSTTGVAALQKNIEKIWPMPNTIHERQSSFILSW